MNFQSQRGIDNPGGVRGRGGGGGVFFGGGGGGGGRIPAGLGWYEFIWKTNTRSRSYMNFQSKSRADKSGGVRG